MAAPGPALVQPVFLLNKTLPAVEEKDYSVAEICAAAERTAGFETVEGAQRIRGLWRLYVKDNEARITLLVSGIILRGHYVKPHEKNPFIVRDANGEDREIATHTHTQTHTRTGTRAPIHTCTHKPPPLQQQHNAKQRQTLEDS